MQSINECWKLDDTVESEESGENVMPRTLIRYTSYKVVPPSEMFVGSYPLKLGISTVNPEIIGLINSLS